MKIHTFFLLLCFLSLNNFANQKNLELFLSESAINSKEISSFLKDATLLIQNGADPDTRTPEGYTLLMLAAWNSFPHIVKMLLELKANPNLLSTDSECAPALIWASISYDRQSIRLLLEYGADPNIQNFYGETALWWAARIGNTESVQLLLEHGADPNIRTLHGDTALIKAVENNRIETVKVLLAYNANKYATKNNGDTPLQIAHHKNLLEIVSLLN